MQNKILHIVRHGKALQEYFSIQDFDRPLIEKGILNNISTARQLLAQYPAPELMVASPAARALHTAHIFAQTMGYAHERVQVNEKLYLDGENEIYRILKSLPDELGSVMMVGHNPDVTIVTNAFGCNVDSIPTSGVVTVRFKTDRWSELNRTKVVQIQKFF